MSRLMHLLLVQLIVNIVIHFTHGKLVLIFTFNTHSNTADSFLFFLIRTINAIIALIVQTNDIDTILIMIPISNVITKRHVNWKVNTSKLIWFILNRDKTVASIAIQQHEFDTSIHKMGHYDVMVTVINDMIINTIDMLVMIFVIIERFLYYLQLTLLPVFYEY